MPALQERVPDEGAAPHAGEARGAPSTPVAASKAASLRGWVVHRGLAVAGARIDLASTRAPGDCVESASGAPADWPFAILGSVEPAANDGTTDEAGAFELPIPVGGWFGLRIEADGFPWTVRGPLALDGAEPAEPLCVELERAGAIEGRVRLADGEAGLGHHVAASNGWGFVTTAALAADGSFWITDLAPGSYQVRAWTGSGGTHERISGRAACAGAVVWDCVVAPGVTTRLESELVLPGAVVLAGRFVLDGQPRRDSWASLCERLAGAEVVRAQSALDEQGSFRLAVSRVGRFTLRVGDHGSTLRSEVELAFGETPWNLRLESGTLRVHCSDEVVLDELGRLRELRFVGFVGFVQGEPGGTEFESRTWLFPEDWEVVVPAGPGRLEARALHGAPEWSILQEIEVRAGEESWVDL